ncbi:MAG: ChaN family lipoprotein [Alphaproteobacteria bacterium]|nr:ChaN family lipoprotein [Alphaproteobacteria bacterium]
MRRGLTLLLLAGAVALLCAPAPADAQTSCVPLGAWVEPGKAKPVKPEDVIDEAADRHIVLLGESHDEPEHQRWALHTIAALHGRRPDMVLGFEAFPRRLQPVLDRWVQGALDEPGFLAEVEWHRVWGFDPAPYMAIFHFARAKRLRMVALNVERQLVARVGREGLAQVPAAEREGIGEPVPARASYLDRLAETYRRHQGADAPPPDRVDPRFLRFVDAQILWDRAMAEALNAASRAKDEPLVVGLMGAGHLANRDGVPAQLHALGRKDAYVMLAWTEGRDCASLRKGLADVVHGVAPSRAAAAPRLGVALDPDPEGARVRTVVAGGVAAAAGLRPGDVVLAAAGEVIADPTGLGAIVRRQPPGTLLPLVVRRDGRFVDLMVEF